MIWPHWVEIYLRRGWNSGTRKLQSEPYSGLYVAVPFDDAPDCYTFVHQWFFPRDATAYGTPAVVRQNYLFAVDELGKLPGAEAIAAYADMFRSGLSLQPGPLLPAGRGDFPCPP